MDASDDRQPLAGQPMELPGAQWRVSDAEREQVAQRLHHAMIEGRLNQTELENRLAALSTARTFGDLGPLTADLPAPDFAARPNQTLERRPTNTMAILSLVLAFAFFPLGAVFGFIARRQIARSGEEGRGLALAGILVSLAQVAMFVAMGVFIAVVATAHVGPVH